MEEILPLIIGILWLLYTFYTKGQKKKSEKQTSSPGHKKRERPSFLEQLLNSEGIQMEPDEEIELLEDPEYMVEEKPVSFESKVKEMRAQPFLSSELSKFKEEGQSQFSDTFIYDQSDESEMVLSSSEKGQQIEDFDLKKAVIFSVILEAPYIDYK